MASPAFEFVQGNERLDWGVLVSIDVERLMKSTTVDTLQRIVENIAFSRVTRDEAALFTPDHILHLFQLCQVVIQYLVYSQEILAEVNVKLNDQMEGQQATAQEQEALLQRLSDETNLLKKQVKTQRRTLLGYEYNAQAALARGLTASGAAGAAGVPATLYVCPYCGDEYHKAESMQSHLRKRHNTSAASPSLPVAATATSPPPPTAGAQTVAPAPAHAPIATAETSEPLQQLRHRVEQLEKDKEAMERQQRENLILMMLGATQSQTTSPPPQQPQQQPTPTPASTSAQPPVSPPPPPPPSSPLPSLTSAPSATTTDTAVNAIPEHLQGIPVVPDISAMMNYNLSCQREASENALRRQLVDLEAEIRALRASKLAEVPAVPKEAPPPPSPSAAAAACSTSAPPSAPGLGVTGSKDPPAVVRPAWVAELENAQQRQHQQQQQQQQSSVSAAPPSLVPPLTPPPAPLPPPPQAAATPTPSPPPPQQQQHVYTAGATVPSLVPPSSHSQSSSTQPQSTTAAAPPILSMPSLCAPPPLRPSSPAPQPSYNIQQQQQPSPAAPSPTPSVPGLSTPAILIPSSTTAPTTGGGAPPPATPTPSVSLPQPPQVHPKPYHWVDSSTNSSLTSTSTVPPHRAVSKGYPGATPSLAPSSATPAMATAASTSATTIPLPSTTSPGALAPSVSSPGLGVGSYFSSRTSAPAAAPLSVIPPPPVTAPELSMPHPTPVPVPGIISTPLSHALSLPEPVLAGGTGGGSTSVGTWSPPAPVPSTARVPVPTPSAVPGAVKPFRPLSSSSSSSSSSGLRFRTDRRYEY